MMRSGKNDKRGAGAGALANLAAALSLTLLPSLTESGETSPARLYDQGRQLLEEGRHNEAAVILFMAMEQTHHLHQKAIGQALQKKGEILQRERVNILRVLKLQQESDQDAQKRKQEKGGETKELPVDLLVQDGFEYLRLNQFILANDRFQKALEISPEHRWAKGGIQQIQRAVREKFSHGGFSSPKERFYLEGFYYYNQGQMLEAMDAWQKAIALESPSLMSHNAVALEDYMGKARYVLNVVERKERIKKIFNRGWNLFRQKQYTQAKMEFELVLKYGPTNTDAQEYLERIEALTSAHKKDTSAREVIPEKKSPAVHDPKKAQEYYLQGLRAYAAGKLRESARFWTAALQQDPNHVRTQNALRRLLKEMDIAKSVR